MIISFFFLSSWKLLPGLVILATLHLKLAMKLKIRPSQNFSCISVELGMSWIEVRVQYLARWRKFNEQSEKWGKYFLTCMGLLSSFFKTALRWHFWAQADKKIHTGLDLNAEVALDSTNSRLTTPFLRVVFQYFVFHRFTYMNSIMSCW